MFISAITTVAATGAKILGGVYLADLVSGAFHWMEDRYGDPKWPILGHTIRENQQHHHTPRSFLKGNLWTRNREVWAIGAAFLAVFALVGWLNLFTGTAVLFGMFANEIHACAHRSPKENGKLIAALQKTGFLQSHAHHAAHHRKGKDSHFCVMTNHVNPVLEKLQVFQRLETLIKWVSGILPRLDDSVNPRYRRAV